MTQIGGWNMGQKPADVVGDPRTYAIIGAAQEVHRVLGRGFLEAVYQDALAAEFAIRRIPFAREVELSVVYKGAPLSGKYRSDFICYADVLVETKAIVKLTGIEAAQIINYLRATGIETGLLLNFGADSLQYERFINSTRRAPIQKVQSVAVSQ
jgi:GxxExxY protein